jgi:hypothetical protein
MAGYIIKNRQMPIGIEIPRICHESMVWLIPGTVCERITPATMHSATQMARYFSNVLTVKTPQLVLLSGSPVRWSVYVLSWSSVLSAGSFHRKDSILCSSISIEKIE